MSNWIRCRNIRPSTIDLSPDRLTFGHEGGPALFLNVGIHVVLCAPGSGKTVWVICNRRGRELDDLVAACYEVNAATTVISI